MLPSVVVVSSSSTRPKSIIRLITKVNPEEQSGGLIVQPWNIGNINISMLNIPITFSSL